VPIGSWERVRALALGTSQQVMAAVKDKLPTEINLASVARILRMLSLLRDSIRFNMVKNLAGEVVGEVTAEEVNLYYQKTAPKVQTVKSPTTNAQAT
jgi:hypothetical protein